MLGTHRAFEGQTDAATVGNVLTSEPKPLAGIPDAVRRLIAASLVKERGRRIQLGTLRWTLGEDADAEWRKVPDAAPEATRAWWLRAVAADMRYVTHRAAREGKYASACFERARSGTGPEARWAEGASPPRPATSSGPGHCSASHVSGRQG